MSGETTESLYRMKVLLSIIQYGWFEQLLSYHNESNLYLDKTNRFYDISKMTGNPIPIDRTGHPDSWNVINFYSTPIPTVPDNWNMSFEEVLIKRAEEIWSVGKPVQVWYSGGIDSVAVLIAFYRTKKPEDKLIVYYSQDSIDEFPSFAERILKLDVIPKRHDNYNTFTLENWRGDFINVTGEPADICFGSYVAENYMDQLDKPWDEILLRDSLTNFNTVRKTEMYDEDDTYAFVEFCREYVKRSPIHIHNIFDFAWWVAFSTKWEWICNRLVFNLTDPSVYVKDLPEKERPLINFYDCPDMQRWSLVNHDLKHKGTWKTYKWPAREFIYNFHSDSGYRDNKEKENSLVKCAPAGSHLATHNAYRDLDHWLTFTNGETITKKDNNYSEYHPLYKYPDLNEEIAFYDKWDILHKSTFNRMKDV